MNILSAGFQGGYVDFLHILSCPLPNFRIFYVLVSYYNNFSGVKLAVTLPKFNSSPLKIGLPKRRAPFFRRYVKLRECRLRLQFPSGSAFGLRLLQTLHSGRSFETSLASCGECVGGEGGRGWGGRKPRSRLHHHPSTFIPGWQMAKRWVPGVNKGAIP